MEACRFGVAVFQPAPVNASGSQLGAEKRKTIRKIALSH
jgi:hypothetical protein